MGLRFEVNRSDLPGSPDIVFPEAKVAIFVHGCFWHRHEGCRKATTPKSNVDYWDKKFRANLERDARKIEQLRQLGYCSLVIWECQMDASPEQVAADVAKTLGSRRDSRA